MKPILAILTLALCACTTITDATGKTHVASKFSIDQRKAFLGDVTALASFAVGAYGGPGAAAGLNALGTIMQGYVGSIIPSNVVAATPAVGSMGPDMAGLISNTKPVTQGDANAMFAAAQLAVGAKPVVAK